MPLCTCVWVDSVDSALSDAVLPNEYMLGMAMAKMMATKTSATTNHEHTIYTANQRHQHCVVWCGVANTQQLLPVS